METLSIEFQEGKKDEKFKADRTNQIKNKVNRSQKSS